MYPLLANTKPIEVSIIIVTYNSQYYMTKLLSNLLDQTMQNFEVIIFDNGSVDQTTNVIQKFISKFDISLILIPSKFNIGFSAAVNLSSKLARGKVIVPLNPDTFFPKTWLEQLVTPIIEQKSRVTTSLILLPPGNKLNTLGLYLTMSGHAFCREFGSPIQTFPLPCLVDSISGASFAIEKTLWEEIGEFDPNFFMYNEDTDLNWRLMIMQERVLIPNGASLIHDYNLTLKPWKFYLLERNRMMIVLTYFSITFFLRNIIYFLIGELLSIGIAVRLGLNGLKAKIQVYRWIIRHRQYIHTRRRYYNRFRISSWKKYAKLTHTLKHEFPWKTLVNQGVANHKVARLGNLLNRFLSKLDY